MKLMRYFGSPEGAKSYLDLLKIDGSFAQLSRAASIVRKHAIETGNPASIRLVRVLKDARSPVEVENAMTVLRRWIEEVEVTDAWLRSNFAD